MRKSRSLDLHGKSVDESLHELEQALSDAIMAGLGQLDVIHGHGSGRVMRAVHDYLSSSPVVRAFKIAEKNRGMTIVYF